MVAPAIIGAGISSAAALAGSIGGGFLSRADHSQRDLIWEQMRANDWWWSKQLKEGPTRTMKGLRRAGLNPMIPFVNGAAVGGASSANVSVPQPYEDPVGRGVSEGSRNSAKAVIDALMAERIDAETENIKETNRKIRAETQNIASQTVLNSAKTASESVQPSLIESIRELNSAKTDSERQALQLKIVETAIAKEELTAAERDAIIADIDIDMYGSTVGEVSRWLEKLGVSPSAAVGMAHMFWQMMRKPISSRLRR